MGAIDQLLQFLESQSVEIRRRIGITREEDSASVLSRGMLIGLREIEPGRVQVSYEHELHEMTQDVVTADVAGRFVLALVMRDRLFRIEVPTPDRPTA